MSPSKLVPTQESIGSSRMANLRDAYESSRRIDPVEVWHTHEAGSEGQPKSFLAHGHHRRQLSFEQGKPTSQLKDTLSTGTTNQKEPRWDE